MVAPTTTVDTRDAASGCEVGGADDTPDGRKSHSERRYLPTWPDSSRAAVSLILLLLVRAITDRVYPFLPSALLRRS